MAVFKAEKKPLPHPFSSTMMDLSYQELEQAALGGAGVLFPISSLEEHGPHLPIGTKTYLTNHLCRILQQSLRENDQSTILAPPLYWGRNVSTGSFPGSFHLTSSTMVGLVADLLADFSRWGFPCTILVSIHADSQHNASLLQALRQGREAAQKVFWLLPEQSLSQYDLSGQEDFLLPYEMPYFETTPPYIDLHAGSFETSWLSSTYPDLVKTDLLETLQNTKTSLEQTAPWSKGWDDFKRAFPLGYVGDPTFLQAEEARKFEAKLIEAMTTAIIRKRCLS